MCFSVFSVCFQYVFGMFLVCFWCVFSVFLMCFQCVFCCVFRKNALFRAQREEKNFSVIVCFQYIFSVFSLCFRFFVFSVLSARQKVCVPKIGFGWSARKSVYLKSGLAGQKVCVPKIEFG